MKKKQLRAAWRMLAGVAILTSMVPVRAQVSNPSAWSEFVSGSGNPQVIDTFRMQSFSGSSVDNWNYTTGKGAVWDEDLQKLKIPLGGTLSFEPYSLLNTQRVSAIITFSVQSIVSGDRLLVDLDNKNGHREGVVYPNGEPPAFSIRFGSNPYRLDFSASTPTSTSEDGYFLIDSVYAYDTIPRYSHFTGKGNWNDLSCWSHLPPMRKRSALISGDVEVNSLIQCGQACLGSGSLHITENARLIIDTLCLYKTGNSLTVDGELVVNKQVITYYTFPEKGKWYFVSFPFNVRPAGLDKRFQWEDASFSGSGNYLYVQVYDGEKRAINNKATGNWTVLSPTSFSGNFLFEKGKGYLVALDAAADDNMLAFSVGADDLPDDFGKTTSIPVSAFPATEEAHSGWYLCGNPLPASLSLSQIMPDPLLDENIYLYDGSNYKSYPIGSNTALPPFSAFFVKAEENMNLTVAAGTLSANAVRLKADYALHSAGMEPEGYPVANSMGRYDVKQSYIKGKILYLTGLPAAGQVQVANYLGQIVYECSIPSGNSTVSLPLPGGFYLVTVRADSYRAQHKCILTQ